MVRRTGSGAVGAESLHDQVDLLVNFSVIVSLVLTARLGWLLADPLFALAIAAYIIYGAWRLGREAMDLVMDRELADDDRQRIRDLALAHPQVLSLHDLRTRKSGPNVFIQLHLEMDADITLRQAHEIAEEVMYDVEAAFPGAEVLIHEDPAGVPERRVVFEEGRGGRRKVVTEADG